MIKTMKAFLTIAFFLFMTFSLSFSAVYLFNSNTGSSSPSGGGEIVEVNLPSACTINLSNEGSFGTVSFARLIQKHCGATWTQSSTLKNPEGYYFTRNMKVILEVAGAKGGCGYSQVGCHCSPGYGGYTKIEFIIPKTTTWNLNIYYVLGETGLTGASIDCGQGGGGSMIVLGSPPYVEPGKFRFPKDKVIAVIAGGGGGCAGWGSRGGHGGGGNNCGTKGSGGAPGCNGQGGGGPVPAPNTIALCGGGGRRK